MIKQGNCLELLKDVPNSCIDFILTDLPFGTTECFWDKKIPLEPLWIQLNRVTKRNAAMIFFSQLPFACDLINSNRKNFRYEWIWEKPLASGHLNSNKMPLKAHENILVFYQALPTYNPQFTQGKPRFYRAPVGLNYYGKCYNNRKSWDTYNDGTKCYPRDVQKFNVVQGHEERFHSTQKPVNLLEYLIRTYTNENETVLDVTMGSGSTGVACVNTNRNFIGFELEEQFFRIAEKRIDEALAKKRQKLFL